MNVIRRTLVVASMALAACVVSTPVLHASTSFASPVHAFYKAKTIQFSLRNDTGVSLSIHAGEAVMSIEPGKTMKVNLVPGTRVTNETVTPKHSAGELLVEVSDAISGATIAIT
jgi:hypothetical protein